MRPNDKCNLRIGRYVVLEIDVMIESHQENVSFKGAVGTKQDLSKTSLQGLCLCTNPTPASHPAGCLHTSSKNN